MSQFSEIIKKLSSVLEWVEIIERSIEQQSAKSDVIMTKLDEIGETISEIENVLEFLSARYDEIHGTIELQGRILLI